LKDKISLTDDDIAEYSGEHKAIKPLTVATYQILTWRKDKKSGFPHFALFDKKEWGLVIYDEVHLLPAPVFRITAQIQAKRRLGLTATLIREDGREGDVFSLIGPKKYDIAWRRLEQAGWIASAHCYEVRVPMAKEERLSYVTSEIRTKFRIASENPQKMPLVRAIISRHPKDQILVIGLYLSQLRFIARMLKVPLIQGSMPNLEREKIYDDFRRGKHKIIVVSKVANFAVDLPDANVAIQISGTFGSRQEEAQRLGRILRPKTGENSAYFYTLVSEETSEEEFAKKRQLFLTEQGYQYFVLIPERVMDGGLGPPQVE
jgi:DNA excision repair protein ERCC-3